MSKAQELVSFMDNAVLRMPYEMVIGSPISQHQFYVRVQSLLDRLESASSEQQAAQQDAQIAKLTTAYTELSKMLHDQIVAQQAAWIEWQHGEGAEAAMEWIENGLFGPGHIPEEDDPYGTEAQAWFDANRSDPFPVCHCGRPSNQLWMGQGFCGNAHFDAARASNGGKA